MSIENPLEKRFRSSDSDSRTLAEIQAQTRRENEATDGFRKNHADRLKWTNPSGHR